MSLIHGNHRLEDQQGVKRYDSEPKPAPTWGHSFWLALICGVLFATMTLDRGYISGNGPAWDAPFGDASTAQIGWFYYAQDAWRFPLFATPTHNVPEGGGIFFSDSVPMLALPAKAVYKTLWPQGSTPPIYMGLWVWLCLILQAIAASRLLIALGVRDPTRHLCGIALFCFMPMLMLRFGHFTLLCHFFILFALDAYVRGKRHGLSRREWQFVCSLPAIGLLAQPYVAAMASVLILATILDQWHDRKLNATGVMVRLGAIVISCIVVILGSGLLTVAITNYNDFGVHSMNLLSPWVPFGQSRSGQWFGVQGTTPSLPGGNQWEGGAWIGLGTAVLLVASLPLLGEAKSFIRRHAILLVLLLGVFAFAVSNRIGLGSHEWHIPLPDMLIYLLSTLRTSGRFAWVLVYVLLAGLIAFVLRRYSPVVSMALLLIAAVLQVIDVRPMQANVRLSSSGASAHSTNKAAWTNLINAHVRLFQFPSFACGGLFGGDVPGSILRELEINWIAAQQNKPANSAYLSRPNKDCERETRQAISDWNIPGTLYLYRISPNFRALLTTNGVDTTKCGLLDDVTVCSADMDLSTLHPPQ